MPPAQLIITADDGGLCSAVDEASVDLYMIGVISRVAVFATNGDVSDLRRALPAYVCVPHVSLTFGAPLTRSDGIRRLQSSDGVFLRPVIARASDLAPALVSHAHHIERTTHAEEIVAEIVAQIRVLVDDEGENGVEFTFHHNLDYFLSPRFYRPSIAARSRRDCVEMGLYSAYRYHFLRPGETADAASRRIARLLGKAIATSAASGGRPAEVALHPSADPNALHGRSSYGAERYAEFLAWKSERVLAILGRGERIGTRFVFR